MKRPYPSLDTKGWIEDPGGVLDSVAANFFITQPSLSNEYRDGIMALPYLIQQYGNSETQVRDEVQKALTTLFSRYFDSAVADVSVDYPDPNDFTRMRLRTFVSVTLGEITYNLARELAISNSKLVKIMEINNG